MTKIDPTDSMEIRKSLLAINANILRLSKIQHKLSESVLHVVKEQNKAITKLLQRLEKR